MNFKKNQGFTLVELIVVIAILGLLVGIGIPAYSGYVGKAQETVDKQNVVMLSNVFNVACADAGVSPAQVAFDVNMQGQVFSGINVTGVSAISMYRRGGTNEITEAETTDKATQIETTFNELMGPPITFKKLTAAEVKAGIVNPDSLAQSAAVKEAYNKVLENLLGTENAENLNKLMASVWGEMGADGLTGKVDWTADIADAMLSMNPDGTFSDLITNCGYAMMDFMGITDADAQMAKAKELAIAKMEQLIKADPTKYAGLSAQDIYNKHMDENAESPSDLEAELFGAAQNSIAVNNAILAAAKNSGSASSNIRDILAGNDPKGQLIASVNSGMSGENPNTGAAMGEVALAYAMYMSYAERKNIQVDDVQDVLNGLDDDGFKAYVNNTDASETDDFQTDMDGYLASMNMINNSVEGNEDAVTDVVLNGFGSNNLNSVLQQAMDSTKTGN